MEELEEKYKPEEWVVEDEVEGEIDGPKKERPTKGEFI